MNTLISCFPSIKEVTDGTAIPLDIFLEYVQNGHWQDQILAFRNIPRDQEEAREKAKKQLPNVTISGQFTHRKIEGLTQHSGFICLDFDDLDDPEGFKDRAMQSDYTYAAFVSASGRGVAVLVRINPEKHGESFDALGQYYFEFLGGIVSQDRSCRDVSRARFVSYDPHLQTNPRARKWTKVARATVEKPPPKVVFVKTDFDEIIAEINRRGVDICPSYGDWLRVGFALADQFGEAGREYFEVISYCSAMSRPGSQASSDKMIERQYTACLKAHGTRRATIASLYAMCKAKGIPIMSEQTKMIAQQASVAMRSKLDKESAYRALADEGVSREAAASIVDQVFDQGITVAEDSEIEIIETWLKQNYSLRRNLITRHVESSGVALEEVDFKDIWRMAKRIFQKAGYDDISRLLTSGLPTPFNPFHEFFEKYKDLDSDPEIIDRYFACIKTSTGNVGGVDASRDYVTHFGKKWLVGAISTLYGDPSNLMLILCGDQDTGKTEFFRRMLPKELLPYYAQSKMDAGKDDQILMCKKMIIFDDEMSGKSKKEEKKMKAILSDDVITVREPYGRASVDMRRIATFCASTNELEVLNDPTGNRRFIPVVVLSIDFAEIDKIDRVQLFIEAYRLWRSGTFGWRLSADDKAILESFTEDQQLMTAEGEALVKCFSRTEVAGYPQDWFTAVEIWQKLMLHYGSNLRYDQVKRELRRLKWRSEQKRVNGENQRRYLLYKIL